MAIFTGTWKDGAGVPFDPGAHLITTYSPGGAAGVNPRRGPDPRHRAKFTATSQMMKHLWEKHTTDEDKATWKIIGGHLIWPRRWDIGAQANAFVTFNATNFGFRWYYDADPPTAPGQTTAGTIIITDIAASQSDQMIRVGLWWDYSWTTTPDNQLWIYQCHPAKDGPKGHMYNTRMIRTLYFFDWPQPDPNSWVAKARWPLYKYDDLRIFVRAGPRRRWTYQSSKTCIVGS